MKIGTRIKSIMIDNGITQAKLAKRLGYKDPTAISRALRKENDIKISTLLKILNGIDCDLLIRDRRSKEKWEVSDK